MENIPWWWGWYLADESKLFINKEWIRECISCYLWGLKEIEFDIVWIGRFHKDDIFDNKYNINR